MHKMILMVACFMMVTDSMAQTNTSAEIITTGSSKLKVKPDVASFQFRVEKKDAVEKTALQKLNMEVDKLIKILNKIGFKNEVIKINDYQVSATEDYGSANRIKNYTASNELSLHFAYNGKAIDAIYAEIEKAGLSDVNIEFESSLSDSLTKASKAQLIQLSINDAKEKAMAIAASLGVKLGAVKHVSKDYQQREAYFLTTAHANYFAGNYDLRYKTSFDKLGPQEKELSDDITITFEIIR